MKTIGYRQPYVAVAQILFRGIMIKKQFFKKDINR